MPLPKPAIDESRNDFITRCMSDANSEFPDRSQRYAVCNSQFEKSLLSQDVESPEFAEALARAFAAQELEAENIISEAFIVGNDDDLEILTPNQILSRQAANGFTESTKSLNGATIDGDNNLIIKGAFDGSTQSQEELLQSTVGTSKVKIVDTPFPPLVMAAFMEVNETHFRCVKAKVTDAVGRTYILEPTVTLKGSDYDSKKVTDEDKNVAEEEILEIKKFILNCNNILSFADVLDKVATDYEGVGWGAIEVIRSKDFKVRKLNHIPASRIRVLEGWKGFVEDLGNGKVTHYQNFGEKVSSKEKDLLVDRLAHYDPDEHGPLNASSVRWSGIDKETGEPTTDFSKMANEVIWIPKVHPNTIYYGYSDVYPALGSLFSDVHIRDYTLQFFEHNTVPRYAIIIEGAKMAPDVINLINQFFTTDIKSKAHKTLIIPVPAKGTEVKIRFEKLDAENKESSFQETRRNNAQAIMVAHGVSPAIIGVHEAASLGSGKGLSQAEIYKDRIVTPSQYKFSNILNRLFRLGLGVRLVSLKFNPLDIRDRNDEMKVLTGYLEKGATSINRVIQQAGLGEPISGGDVPFLNNNGVITFIEDFNDKNILQMRGSTSKDQQKSDPKKPNGALGNTSSDDPLDNNLDDEE